MFFWKKKTGPVEWLIVCLGNPGPKYEKSRHNVGFMVADCIAERYNLPIQRLKYKALTADLTLGGKRVLLLKPITYMNLSGESVQPAAAFFKIPLERILVISDDVALPVGKLRIRRSGSAGGHNGLKHIIERLGSDQFPRLRLGVGAPSHPDFEMADWVTSEFSKQDEKTIAAAVERAADATEAILRHGIPAAMDQFNGV